MGLLQPGGYCQSGSRKLCQLSFVRKFYFRISEGFGLYYKLYNQNNCIEAIRECFGWFSTDKGSGYDFILVRTSWYLSEVDDEPEVSKFADSVHPDEDVVRLDVHVDKVVVVKVLDRLKGKKGNISSFFHWKENDHHRNDILSESREKKKKKP